MALRPRVDGATVVITGASSGIGKALAMLLAPRAASLVLVARRGDALHELRTALLASRPALAVHDHACDLTDGAALDALADQVLAQCAGVDVLVNNAGAGDFALLEVASGARLDAMLRLNIGAPVQLTRRLLPALRAAGRGGIVNIGSGAGLSWMPGMAAYVGSKHFIDGFSESLRLELAADGLVVTQVCPGPVASGFDAAAGIDPGRMGAVASWLRIGAEQCARESLHGFEQGRALVIPGARFRAAMHLQAMTPRFMQRWAMRSALQLPALLDARATRAGPATSDAPATPVPRP
ncbi:MAG: SDR family NAD(P)-dependent oxidoreductase [Pseudomonadota bacterium]|nr:SDR family NAD(P)-dependent oxidoreductase [Pseudomonadota bacterium]